MSHCIFLTQRNLANHMHLCITDSKIIARYRQWDLTEIWIQIIPRLTEEHMKISTICSLFAHDTKGLPIQFLSGRLQPAWHTQPSQMWAVQFNFLEWAYVGRFKGHLNVLSFYANRIKGSIFSLIVPMSPVFTCMVSVQPWKIWVNISNNSTYTR